MRRSEELANSWRHIAPVTVGGVATGMRGEEFIAGRYVKQGATITSRGCNNHCWFCSVWKRDGKIRELDIVDGWNVLDDNLLSCSGQHIDSVFEMLVRQKEHPVFTGGLEAKLITCSIAEKLHRIKPQRVYCAYDTEDDREPLAAAIQIMQDAGFKTNTSHVIACYVLIGYPKDTMQKAEERLNYVLSLGVMPYAMLWRDDNGKTNHEWRNFQREWLRPQIVATKMKSILKRTIHV
jgi:hypothetical protein